MGLSEHVVSFAVKMNSSKGNMMIKLRNWILR